MLSYLHVVTGSKQTDQTINLMIAHYFCVCYQWAWWERCCILAAKFDQHYFIIVVWFSKTEITDGTGILVLVRVLWDVISKIYWQFWHCFFKNTLGSSYNLSHWNNVGKNGTFSVFDTSAYGNETFVYIMTFHCTSV